LAGDLAGATPALAQESRDGFASTMSPLSPLVISNKAFGAESGKDTVVIVLGNE
jgi:hypothetical protein